MDDKMTHEENLNATVANDIEKHENLLTALQKYVEEPSRPEDLLFKAIDCLENYLTGGEKNLSQNLKEIHNPTEQCYTIINNLSKFAETLFLSQDYNACCQVLEVTLDIVDQSSFDEDNVELPSKTSLMLKLSSSYLKLGVCDKGIKIARECLEIGLEQSNKILKMQCYIILANAYQRENNFLEAISYNSKLLGIGRQLDESDMEQVEWNNQLECQILWNVSACYNSISDTETALRYANEYLKIVTCTSQDNLTKIYSYIGKLQRQQGQLTEAIKSHELELAICKRFQDRLGMASAYGNIGLVYAAMGNNALSAEFINQQLLIAKALNNSESVVNAVKNQAEAYMKLGNHTLAIEHFTTLLKLAREKHQWKVQCTAYKNIGKLYQTQGTLNFARYYLEEAMNRAKECNMKEDEIDAEMHLAQVLRILGYYEDARKHFKESILYFENMLNTVHHFEILIKNYVAKRLESCCRGLQDVLVKLKCYKEALEISELNRSRIYFNILKRRNATTLDSLDTALPMTVGDIEKTLEGLSPNSTVLYYALSENSYHLWMLKPQRGLVKFVTQNALASTPLDALVRCCMESLAVGEKGNRCCYDSEYKGKQIDGIVSDSTLRVDEDITKLSGKSTSASPSTRNMAGENAIQGSAIVSTKHKEITTDSPCNAPQTLLTVVDESTDHCTEKAPCSTPVKKSKAKKEKMYDSGYDSGLASSKPCAIDDTLTLQTRPESVQNLSPDQPFISRELSSAASTETKQNYQGNLRELFKLLLGKVEHLLHDLNDGDDILFVPDGILSMVPFHLLTDVNKTPLHQKFQISVVPCLAAVSVKERQGIHQKETAVVIGNPSLFGARLKNINGDTLSYKTENCIEELRLVSTSLGVDSISGQSATKNKFLKESPNANLVYISCLGSISDGYLLLTPNTHRENPVAESSSFVFSLEDLSQITLKASLVVLSSCDQCPHGLSEAKDFNLNLATGFLAAGAVAVVVFQYAMPHKAKLVILHRLFRLLEEGKSVRKSLQTIYNEMSTSEELSHPGYWGGIILVGGDATVDIRNVRRKAQEKAINDGTGLIRSSVCLKDLEHSFDEFNLGEIAKRLKSLLASILAMQENLIALDALENLVDASIDKIQQFSVSKSHMDGRKLPAIRMNNELVKMPPVQKLLLFLGYKLEPSLEEDDVIFLMLPPWNFDELLQAILLCVRYLQSIRRLSVKATFSLARSLPHFDETTLHYLAVMLQYSKRNPEKPLNITEMNVNRLWATVCERRFLQDIGFYTINTSLYLRNGSIYDELQCVTQDLLNVLLLLYRNGELLMSQLYSDKFEPSSPWNNRKPTQEEVKAKHWLARRLHTTRRDFRTMDERGIQWHIATIDSWRSEHVEVIEIGPKAKEKERVERYYHGILKVKVKPGGTPSSSRFPIIEKRNVTKYDKFRQREKLANVYFERKDALKHRNKFEMVKAFTTASH